MVATLDRLVQVRSQGVERFLRHYEGCINRWSESRYALDKRFVQLTLLLDQGEQAQGQRWQAAPENFQDLHQVLANAPAQALVLLGPPGSGKSTLLRNFELECAQKALREDGKRDITKAPLSLFVPLGQYRAKPGKGLPEPKEWLSEKWAQQNPELVFEALKQDGLRRGVKGWAKADLKRAFEILLKERELTLLLDGLNEIPSTRRNKPVERWKGFLAELKYHGKVRVVFSCRSLDYSAPLASKELPVPHVRIELLSDKQVKRFLKLYFPKHAASLWKKLQGTPQLDLFRSPYYLKMLVEQAADGEIPQGRSQLFTGFIRQALRREVASDNELFLLDELIQGQDRLRLSHGAWETPFELPEGGILFPQLSHLAFEMQTRRPNKEAAQVRIKYAEALNILGRIQARAKKVLKGGFALGVLEQDLGPNEVLYVHQLLQEYFAGRRLASQPQPALVKQEWRAQRVSPSLQETMAKLAYSDPLPPLPGSGWEETTVLAAAMAQDPDGFVASLMEQNLALAGRCAAQPDAAVLEELSNQLRWALVGRTQDEGTDLRARIAAGLALGELGDPRFERRTGQYGPYLLPPLIDVPGGTYRIGSDEHYERERPVHSVELVAFRLGKFPVTNAEWALFMNSGGYEHERWWEAEDAKAWRRSSRQTQPLFWNDDAFNNPGQPVVGMCWHEARAYCAWLSAQARATYRLPTEVEWEAAARGRANRSFAYGDRFDPSRGNTWDTHILRTTPIGVFPGGDTPGPAGLVDMTGNVWEWTSSLYKPYPYVAGDGREDAASSGRRVVRGGSCLNSQDGARTACRCPYGPDGRNYGIGFRVVSSSPIFLKC
jgi:formylglycine-generating enzyme required for sulfatase activity